MSVVTELAKAGIDVEEYRRGPLGRHVFFIAVREKDSSLAYRKNGIVRIWRGDAEIDVNPDKNYRQAVLDVYEPKHKISRPFSFSRPAPLLDRSAVLAVARQRFNIFVPRNSRLSVSYVTQSIPIPGPYVTYRGIINVNVPETRQYFLTGWDEKYHFVAALPEAVKSVEEAHDVLRPQTVPDGSLRQGEWFFVPVKKSIASKLDNIAANNPNQVTNRRLERGSTHWARQALSLDDKLYAVGYVFDERISHHQGLYLDDWHMVVRNRETVLREEQRVRRSDGLRSSFRRRGWD